MLRLRFPVVCLVLPLTFGWAGEVPERLTPEELERQKAQVYSLTAGLRDPSFEKVQAAAEALAATGSPLAVPYLWQLYDAGAGDRRRTALEALSRIEAPGQEERCYAVSLLDPLQALRRLAAELLARRLGRDRATDRYVSALVEPLKQVPPLTAIGRLRACQLLTHLNGAGTSLILRKLLADPDPDLVVAACEGLGAIGDAGSATELLALLKANDPELAPAALDALERISGLKHGRSLVLWGQWLEDLAQGKSVPPARKPTGKPNEGAGTEESYVPDAADPYVRPVTESAVDFAVIFDTTGSMTHVWPELCAAIDGVISEMAKKTPSLRLGSVRYRASDVRNTYTYLIQPKPLTRKLQDAKDFILDASFGGGSGGLHLGLQHAISAFAWRALARKVVLVVGDTTPSGDGLARTLGMAKEGWEQDRIVFNGLYVRTIHGPEHEPCYRLLAEAGAGRFYEYNKQYRHLLDMSQANVDPKTVELFGEIYPKWLSPLLRVKK